MGYERRARVAVHRVPAPDSLGQRHDAAPNPAAKCRFASHLTEVIEDPNVVAICNATLGGIVGMHQQAYFGAWNFCQRRADGLVARGRDQREWEVTCPAIRLID